MTQGIVILSTNGTEKPGQSEERTGDQTSKEQDVSPDNDLILRWVATRVAETA